MKRIQHYYVGIDDTDYGDSIGTGALARELTLHLERELGATSAGITRHQFLLHPDIPYTSHNSSACIGVSGDLDLSDLRSVCEGFIRFLFHPGADPGLCIGTQDQLTDAAVEFGRRAQREIVTKSDAHLLANAAGMHLTEHGGEGIGVIGAFAGATLRMDGNDGRFISHLGIREVPEVITAADLVSNTAVESVITEQGDDLAPATRIRTNNWVRPNLVHQRVVQPVHPISGSNEYQIVKKHKSAAAQ